MKNASSVKKHQPHSTTATISPSNVVVDSGFYPAQIDGGVVTVYAALPPGIVSVPCISDESGDTLYVAGLEFTGDESESITVQINMENVRDWEIQHWDDSQKPVYSATASSAYPIVYNGVVTYSFTFRNTETGDTHDPGVRVNPPTGTQTSGERP
jgi:hypothetical protein